MGKEGRRFLPNLKKLGSPRLNFDEVTNEKGHESVPSFFAKKDLTLSYIRL